MWLCICVSVLETIMPVAPARQLAAIVAGINLIKTHDEENGTEVVSPSEARGGRGLRECMNQSAVHRTGGCSLPC